MARLILAALTGGLVLMATTSCSVFMLNEEAKEEREYSAEFAPGVRFDVQTGNGSVELIKDPEAEDVFITARLKAKGETVEDAEARLVQLDVVITMGDDGVMGIRAVFPDDGQSGDGCSFVITTPGGIIGHIKTSNGKITTRNVAGPGTLDTSNGSIHVVGATDGKLDCRTSNGKIVITGASGHVKAKTSNGSIELVMNDDARNGFDVLTSNGAVTVDVPRAMGGTISADTSNGRVKVDNPDRAESIDLKKQSGRIVLDGNGPDSKIRTSNGSVTIRIGTAVKPG